MRASKLKSIIAMAMLSTTMPLSAVEEMEIYPTQETLNELHRQKGGSPEQFRQAQEALSGYNRAEDYIDKKEALRDSFVLRLDELRVKEEIRVARGFLTTITILDVTGNPWPVKISRSGNKKVFSIAVGNAEPDQTDVTDTAVAHIITIEAKEETGRTNVKLFFEGLHKPVVIPLVISRKSYHDDVVITIPTKNPDVEENDSYAGGSSYQRASSILIEDTYARGLSDGVAASQLGEALEMNITMMNIHEQHVPAKSSRAIRVGNKVYLKAPLREVNPPPIGITRGLHGYSVFKFDNLPRLITGQNKHGETILVKISEPSDRYGLRHLPVEGVLR